MAARTDPRLPQDLERTIFELLARSEPSHAPPLLRVAWRVKHWIEPLLYRILIVTATRVLWDGIPPIRATTLLDRIASKPAAFFASSVRHLFLLNPAMGPMDSFAVNTILRACTGITTLSSGHIKDPAQLAALATLDGLHVLTASLDWIEWRDVRSSLAHPAFRNITHLELPPNHGSFAEHLNLLPRLTHLAFHDAPVLNFLPELLAMGDGVQLRCVVYLLWRGGAAAWAAKGYLDTLLGDERCVAVELPRGGTTTRSLIRGAAVGDDYWGRAERLIAARRAGTVDRSQILCLELELDETV
ncbi:hypothetical protein C8R46DRAFT_1346947 [Mycena filopes]|nr:hypothetical protein C8R46DRAFT_1346947 [Mycena filopes]